MTGDSACSTVNFQESRMRATGQLTPQSAHHGPHTAVRGASRPPFAKPSDSLSWSFAATTHNLPNYPSELFCARRIDDLHSEGIMGHIFGDCALNRLHIRRFPRGPAGLARLCDSKALPLRYVLARYSWTDERYEN